MFEQQYATELASQDFRFAINGEKALGCNTDCIYSSLYQLFDLCNFESSATIFRVVNLKKIMLMITCVK
jgi:hypothetical protein